MMIGRREFLWYSLAGLAARSLPLRGAPRFQSDPFVLGVNAGEPTADGAVLWTRLAPKPLEPSTLPNSNIEVEWFVAEDEKFSKVARKGKTAATPALAHSVHVEVAGLKPHRWYWYRFRAGGEMSPAGRFRTAPAAGADRIRLAVASCQQYTQGLYTAYEHMSAEDLDLVVHLGDYIYEQGYRGTIRPEGAPEIYTLDDYRRRYSLYKSDPLLRKAHANFAWAVTWDDHEVSNNYANDIQEDGDPRETFLQRRAAAYQAFYEHMPVRRASIPDGPNLLLYRRLQFGDLLTLHMLDSRQYRTDQPCLDGLKPVCDGVRDPNQTLLGRTQENWLTDGLASSKSVWNALGQQIMMTYQDFDNTEIERLNMDSWSGYDLARERCVAAMKRTSNPVVLTGDVHAHWLGEVRQNPRDPQSPCVAPEFVGTSISSGGDGADITERAKAMMPVNPQIRFFNGQRGYLSCELTRAQWLTRYRVMDFVTRPGGSIATRASFAVQSGNPIPQPV